MKKKLVVLAILLGVLLTSAQASKVISGTVYDTNNSPLPGVNVMIKGSSNGTITNIDGGYSIEVASNQSTLVFSFIGCMTEEVQVGNRLIINVTLKESKVELDEVVSSGYGCVKEKQFATSGCCVLNAPVRKSSSYEVESYNTEGYSSIHENGYKTVLDAPLSTFSVDVDRASYANVRRYINSGSLPPKDAVRIEEMINYFDYSYKEPVGETPFSISSELATCPWNNSHHLFKVALKGRDMDLDETPNSNLVFLLDVSGSMNAPNKLPLLKSALKLLINQLRDDDKVSIVVYAGASGLVLPATSGSQKMRIVEAMDQLQAGGSTAGGAGLRLAYKVAQENFIKGGNNRIILATDGDFNVGVSSNADMEQLVIDNREKGVAITVLGFGMGNYKDDKLEIIANKGNGNYSYIDNLQEAQKTLVKEFGGTLFTIAKDVKFQLEFNPENVLAYRLVGYENRLLNDEDFKDDKKDAGEIGAGHVVTALYEIIPVGAKDAVDWMGSVDPLKYQSTKIKQDHKQTSDELLTIKLRYKKPEGDKSKLVSKIVKNKVFKFDQSSSDFRFAASVASFGMLLRASEYIGSLTYERVIEIAENSKGTDEDGYRSEMIRLVKTSQQLGKNYVSNLE